MKAYVIFFLVLVVFGFSSLANASAAVASSARANEATVCLKKLKEYCVQQSFKSAIVRCSWQAELKPEASCKKLYSDLFSYQLWKANEFKAAECRTIKNCEEYSDLNWQKKHKAEFKTILTKLRKHLLNPDAIEKLYEGL